MTNANPVAPLTAITGVYVVTLRAYEDARGRFMETFRREWFPGVNWDRMQTNRSDSRAGVLRGLHYHHRQIDYWIVMQGTIRVGLADLRPSSPTFGAATTLDMGEANMVGLFIPSGVAHGFVALTDATLTYIVNNYYDGADEHGVAWDDPDLALAWGVNAPLLSPRDQANPRLRDIPTERLPGEGG
jgi:dTDP-4-dehydrorhamnose 3,5-epimerase